VLAGMRTRGNRMLKHGNSNKIAAFHGNYQGVAA
jgi:hypothetical protein